MKPFLIILVLNLIPYMVNAQQIKELQGTVVDSENKPINNVLVTLFDLKDQVISKVASNENGGFTLPYPDNTFYLHATSIGYLPFRKDSITQNNIHIVLAKSPILIQDITITGSKKFLEQQPDKLIVHVDGNLKAGFNAIDVLKKIPGVTLNREDLQVEGKSVTVLIDGKPKRMSGLSLVNLLENTATPHISKMEIIYNPSSKYDAAGDGGIINIQTLKRVVPGYDANMGLTIGHGWKYPTLSSSIGINYKAGKNAVIFSFGQSVGKQYQEIETTNTLLDLQQTLVDSSKYNTNYQNNNLRLAIDRNLNNGDLLGVLLTGNYGTRKPGFSSKTEIFPKVNDNYTLSDNPSKVISKGLNLNINYKHIIDKKKLKELSIDADAGSFNYQNPSENFISEIRPQLPLVNKYYIQNGKTQSEIYSIKSDYSQKMTNGMLEAGLKISHVNLQNNFTSLYAVNPMQAIDYGSNDFLYKETIAATYINGRINFMKFSFQLGLRAEETLTNGISKTLQNEVNRNYISLFPNVSTSYKFDKNNFSLSYNRRIGRPSYNELNPFVIINNPYRSRTGNPYLLPSFTQNIRLAYSYNNKLNVSSSYATTKDVITDFQIREEFSEMTKVLKDNISSYQNIGLNLSYSNTFFKFWQVNYGISTSNSNYKFIYNNEPQQIKQTTGSLSLGNTFQINKSFYAEIYFYGQSKVTYGSYINKPFSTTNVSAGKKLFNGNGNIGLNINDIFFTGITKSIRKYGNIDYNLKSTYDSRNIRINFTYRFGNSKIDLRRKIAGSEEEQRRNL